MRSDERRYELDGLAVVERIGEGIPVVLVHGAMDRASSFGRVVRKLGDTPVLRYDRRGYGRSEPGRSVGLAGHVADLSTVIAGREVVVFGHSYGGTIALGLAASGSSSILALATYESPVPSAAPVTPHRFDPDAPPSDVAEGFMRKMVGDRIWSRLPPRTREDRRAEGPALIADFDAVRDEAPAIDLERVRIPVLVGFGEASADEQRERGAVLASTVDDGELWPVPGGDHGVHFGRAAAVAEIVGELRRRATSRRNGIRGT